MSRLKGKGRVQKMEQTKRIWLTCARRRKTEIGIIIGIRYVGRPYYARFPLILLKYRKKFGSWFCRCCWVKGSWWDFWHLFWRGKYQPAGFEVWVSCICLCGASLILVGVSLLLYNSYIRRYSSPSLCPWFSVSYSRSPWGSEEFPLGPLRFTLHCKFFFPWSHSFFFLSFFRNFG